MSRVDDALLIDAGDGVLDAQGSGEVLEDPLGGAGEPGEGLLHFEVPVEEIAGVGLGPVAVLGDAGLAAGVQVGEAALVGAVAGRDLGEDLVGVLGVAAGVAVGAPFGVEEMVDALALRFEGLLVLGDRCRCTSRPRWRASRRRGCRGRSRRRRMVVKREGSSWWERSRSSVRKARIAGWLISGYSVGQSFSLPRPQRRMLGWL